MTTINSRFSLSNPPKPLRAPIDRFREPTWMEATFGAAAYGALDIGSATLRRASKLIPGDEDFLQQGGDYLTNVKNSHPNWAPQQVDSAWDLLTSPKALAGVTSSQAAYFGSLLALAGAGALTTLAGAPVSVGAAVGGIGSALLAYAVEGQSAYDEAIASGASRRDAEIAANTIGPISAAVEMLQVTRVLKFAGGAKNALIRKAASAASSRLANLDKATGGNLTKETIKLVAMEGLQESLQGSVHELGAFAVYGKPIDPGFIDRRLQEFIGVGPSAILFGGAGRALPRGKVKDFLTGQDMTLTEDAGPITSPNRQKLYDEFLHAGVKEPELNAAFTVADRIARSYGRQNNTDANAWYEQKFTFNAIELLTSGDVLAQKKSDVGGYYSALDRVLKNPEVRQAFGDKALPSGKISKLLAQGQVKKEELIWTGISDILKNNEFVRYDELVKAAQDNRIELVNTVLGGINEKVRDDLVKDHEEKTKIADGLMEQIAEVPQELLGTPEHQMLVDMHAQAFQEQEDSWNAMMNYAGEDGQYSEITVPGPHEDYGELLIRMPKFDTGDMQIVPVNDKFAVKFNNTGEVGPQRYATEKEAQDWMNSISQVSGEDFKAKTGGHFDHPYVMVHARFDTRKDELGRKVLFIHELQSDAENTVRKNLKEAASQVEIVERINLNGRLVYDLHANGKELAHGISTKAGAKSRAKELQQDIKEKSPKLLEQNQEILRDFPFFGNSQALAIRAMYQYAAQNGFDVVALTDAESIAGKVGQTTKDADGKETGFARLYKEFLPARMISEAKRFDKSASLEKVQIDINNSDFDDILPEYHDALRSLMDGKTLEVIHVTAHKAFYVLDSEGKQLGTFDTKEKADKFIETSELLLYQESKKTEFNAITISPTLRDGVAQGIPLFQSDKGRVTFLKDGRAVVQAFKGADASTALHELFHVARRSAIVSEDLKTLETFFKVKDGQWTIESEEAAARAFERYIGEGQAPTAGLQKVFAKLRSVILDIYKGFLGNIPSAQAPISREVKAVFDRMLHEDSSDITKVRAELDELDEMDSDLSIQIDSLRKKEVKAQRENQQLGLFTGRLPNITKKQIELGKFDTEQIESLVTARNKVRNSITLKEGELQKLQQRLHEDEVSEIDNAQSEEVVMERVKELSAQKLKERKGVVNWLKDSFGSYLGSMSAPLYRRESGKLTLSILQDMNAYANGISGRLWNDILDSYQKLTSSDRAWLKHVDEDTSNMRRLLDTTGVRDVIDLDSAQLEEGQLARLKEWRDSVWKVFHELGVEARDIGLLRRMEDGRVVVFQPSTRGKLPRIPTDYAWKAITDGSGVLYNDIVKAIQKHNPELTIKDVEKDLQNWLGQKRIRRNGSLEETRRIRFMPDHVTDSSGKRQAIFHTDPFYMMTRAVDLQTKRLAMVKFFGQSNLFHGVSTRALRDITKALDVRPKFTEAQKKQLLIERINTQLKGDDEIYKSMDTKALVALAKQLKVHNDIGREQYLDALLKVNPARLSEAQQGKIRNLAKGLGGIETKITSIKDGKRVSKNRDINEVFKELLYRTGYDAGNPLAKLRAMYGKEGGNVSDFDDIFRVWQGIPYKWLARNPVSRTLNTLSTAIGAAQISLMVAPNVVQTLAQVPRYGGWARFSQAWKDSMLAPEMTRAQITATGAFRDSINHWMLERGYYPEGLARNLMQSVSKVTGARFVNDLNSTIAGRVGKIMIDDFRTFGASRKDIRTMKEMGLNEKEIQLALNGKVAKLTENKFISNMISKTQFTTEQAHLRSKTENIPILRMLFAYSNYTFGATRALARTFGDIRDLPKSVKAGDVGAVWGTISRTTSMLVGSLGAGMAGAMLRQALKGRPPEEELPNESEWEGIWQRGMAALLEVQLLGATQRMLDPFKYGEGSMEKVIIGFAPKVKYTLDLIGTMLHYGKYGQFGLADRAGKTLLKNTPLAGATANWIDNLAYPAKLEFEQASQVSGKFKRDVLKREPFPSDQPINPLYFNIYERVKRNDMDGAIAEAKIYYQKQLSNREFIQSALEQGQDPFKKARTNLRSSLNGRMPGSFNDLDLIKFFGAMNTDQKQNAARVIMRYRRAIEILAPR